jgi:hypothetical protein
MKLRNKTLNCLANVTSSKSYNVTIEDRTGNNRQTVKLTNHNPLVKPEQEFKRQLSAYGLSNWIVMEYSAIN